MTKVIINSGICGFSTVVIAEQGPVKKVRITLESECEMVQKMNKDLTELDLRTAFTNHINNPVYRCAAQCLKHVACPVPSGILKALEVELGLCLPKDASILFIKE